MKNHYIDHLLPILDREQILGRKRTKAKHAIESTNFGNPSVRKWLNMPSTSTKTWVHACVRARVHVYVYLCSCSI